MGYRIAVGTAVRGWLSQLRRQGSSSSQGRVEGNCPGPGGEPPPAWRAAGGGGQGRRLPLDDSRASGGRSARRSRPTSGRWPDPGDPDRIFVGTRQAVPLDRSRRVVPRARYEHPPTCRSACPTTNIVVDPTDGGVCRSVEGGRPARGDGGGVRGAASARQPSESRTHGFTLRRRRDVGFPHHRLRRGSQRRPGRLVGVAEQLVPGHRQDRLLPHRGRWDDGTVIVCVGITSPAASAPSGARRRRDMGASIST
jgi:hypothetical protein